METSEIQRPQKTTLKPGHKKRPAVENGLFLDDVSIDLH